MTKKVQPIMLATEDDSVLRLDASGNLYYHTGFIRHKSATPRHLYFVDDSATKKGDYFYQNNRIGIAKTVNFENHFNIWKVWASTDPSLNLPIIPESFVKDYIIAQGKISDIWLETMMASEIPCIGQPDFDWANDVEILKLTDNNEVIIKNKCADYLVHFDVANLCTDCKELGVNYCRVQKFKEKYSKRESNSIEKFIEELLPVLNDPVSNAAMNFYNQHYQKGAVNSGIIISIFEAGIKYQQISKESIVEELRNKLEPFWNLFAMITDKNDNLFKETCIIGNAMECENNKPLILDLLNKLEQ